VVYLSVEYILIVGITVQIILKILKDLYIQEDNIKMGYPRIWEMENIHRAIREVNTMKNLWILDCIQRDVDMRKALSLKQNYEESNRMCTWQSQFKTLNQNSSRRIR